MVIGTLGVDDSRRYSLGALMFRPRNGTERARRKRPNAHARKTVATKEVSQSEVFATTNTRESSAHAQTECAQQKNTKNEIPLRGNAVPRKSQNAVKIFRKSLLLRAQSQKQK